ncbi:hypothetical protein HPB51_007505 [Rhipicephalus microplus]|uniref:Tick transposon n=1 Tax=Rhipicephalus microplus TaxID=6941 RepID=A0A9J6EYN2_RHIMP|nr:hypothetical protein HPB51_007505 [Rhipicephalus microplus]
MWQSRRALTKRWKQQQLNSKLRHSIAEISERENAYEQQLETASWATFRDSLRGTIHTSKTWAILRSIMEPGKTKTSANRTLKKLAGEFPGTDHALFAKLRDKYIGAFTTPPCTLAYQGQENAVLDAPITKAELFAAAQAAKRNTAPGLDQLTNAMIRNLSDEYLEQLTRYFIEQEINKTDLKALDALIRTSYKVALGPPLGASTERLEALGIHNHYEELCAVVLISQRERLNLTTTGRKLLRRVGYPAHSQYVGDELESMAKQLRENILVCPIPKNMSPPYQKGRRSAGARKLQRQFGNNPDTVYADVALCGTNKYVLAVVGAAPGQSISTCAMARAVSASNAEALGIALAI